jgi:predicted alpha/beta superfamily hydrolase
MYTQWHTYPSPSSAAAHTVVGDVRVSHGISGFGLAVRDIYVYLPPSYAHSRKRYATLYLQDGQNVFDEATAFVGEWGCDEAAQKLAQRGYECIIVGIPNAGPDRLSEYNPWNRAGKRFGVGQGEAYLNFVTQVIKPIVDASFRTRRAANCTGIGGSSMGGLIALYAALTRADIFGFCMAMSTSVWAARSRVLALLKTAPRTQTRFYVDIGQQEGPQMLSDARLLYAKLVERGFTATYLEDRLGEHNEKAWRKRFPKALLWFLNPATQAVR